MNVEETKKLYEEGLASGASGEAGAFIPPDLHVTRLQHAADMINDIHPKTLLDVGCGRGLLLNYIDTTDIGYHGIDIVPALIDMAKTDFPDAHFKVGEVEDTYYQYEMVVCLGVLSHVTDNEMPKFVQLIAQKATKWVVMEIQHPAFYRSGRFHAHEPEQVSAVLRAAGFSGIKVYLPTEAKESAYHILASK